ncbi:MAG TPA: capsule biosynthesis protein CapK, partial [Blastocatellia bacterium]|nr:capsule biosynthesis protein CapK [Blastocatellia bacterium]
MCLAEVPFYRRRGGRPEDFFALPTCGREDLAREPWSFVPDGQPLDEMIVYDTSGTSSRPIYILSHPVVASMYLPALRAALKRCGVTLEGGSGRVSIITVCAQSYTLTYATISSYLDGAGYVKVNLNPKEWRDPDDRALFLDSCNPEIYTGDPVSFLALAKLPLETRPKALVSSAMTLLPGLKRELEEHFECPVLDVYSMNESRFIAVDVGAGYEIIPHDLYVEILDREGNACPPGVRGEIVLTGGRNPFLPLLRYRTGDYAALEFRGRQPVLVDFEGRKPTVFINTEGRIVNNIDVTYALKPFPIGQFSLHQNRDRSLLFRLRESRADEEAVRKALLELFGRDQKIVIEELTEDLLRGGKVLQYTSDIAELSLESSEIYWNHR